MARDGAGVVCVCVCVCVGVCVLCVIICQIGTSQDNRLCAGATMIQGCTVLEGSGGRLLLVYSRASWQ